MATPIRPRTLRGVVSLPEPLPPSFMEPPLDLSTVEIPHWLMPTLRDLMDVAERTFPGLGRVKKAWVRQALLDAFSARELDHLEPELAPGPFRASLLDILIEGVWALHFRHPRPKSVLSEALARLKDVGGKLAAARDQGFVPS